MTSTSLIASFQEFDIRADGDQQNQNGKLCEREVVLSPCKDKVEFSAIEKLFFSSRGHVIENDNARCPKCKELIYFYDEVLVSKTTDDVSPSKAISIKVKEDNSAASHEKKAREENKSAEGSSLYPWPYAPYKINKQKIDELSIFSTSKDSLFKVIQIRIKNNTATKLTAIFNEKYQKDAKMIIEHLKENLFWIKDKHHFLRINSLGQLNLKKINKLKLFLDKIEIYNDFPALFNRIVQDIAPPD
ncbi:MAG: hypothetical protein H0W88_12340 [Parachlamydiaceae bacterium]|nr:hypothetical protein [Parachlamydiaceae bacterium]